MNAIAAADIIIIAFSALFLRTEQYSTKIKRQLYREQVSPHLGGKIPDSAFHTDRLALNRLNKEGFTIPDGVVLERKPIEYSHQPEQLQDVEKNNYVIRVLQSPDNRIVGYGAGEQQLETVESTYLVRPAAFGPRVKLPLYRPTVGKDLPIIGGNNPNPISWSHQTLVPPSTHRFRPNRPNFGVYTNQVVREWAPLLSSILLWEDDRIKLSQIREHVSSFVCDGSGRMYADPETNCQTFHLCHRTGQRETFFCPPGMVFHELSHECRHRNEIATNCWTYNNAYSNANFINV